MIVRGVIAGIAGISSLAAEASFTNTIGLGSVLVGMLVVILFGAVTFKERRNSGWKDLYEQERERKEILIEEKEDERVVRHGIKDELAATRALLEIEKMKPDLSVILEQQRLLWTEATNGLTDTLLAMQKTQEQMLAILTKDAPKGATP